MRTRIFSVCEKSVPAVSRISGSLPAFLFLLIILANHGFDLLRAVGSPLGDKLAYADSETTQ